MTASINVKRTRAAVRQGYRCYYCGLPMWDNDPDDFISRHRLSRRQARLLQCTAEHLHARVDGGSNVGDNIAAACRFCNSHRHHVRNPLPPALYRARVTQRMGQGRWLAGIVPQVAGR